jgi:hypothetical protein
LQASKTVSETVSKTYIILEREREIPTDKGKFLLARHEEQNQKFYSRMPSMSTPQGRGSDTHGVAASIAHSSTNLGGHFNGL